MVQWSDFLASEKQKPYFTELMAAVADARRTHAVFPVQNEVFAALSLTPLESVRCVILGQDPYHGPGQAHGLAFSVPEGVKIPPSLRNIYKELHSDIAGFAIPAHGNLTSWAQQGVLLLNTVLTVEQGKAHSHARLGWETFTEAVIAAVNSATEHTVFMLWGGHAQRKGACVDSNRHCVLTAPHPSPLSAHKGFLGCGHFSQANHYLQQHNKTAINWQV